MGKSLKESLELNAKVEEKAHKLYGKIIYPVGPKGTTYEKGGRWDLERNGQLGAAFSVEYPGFFDLGASPAPKMNLQEGRSTPVVLSET